MTAPLLSILVPVYNEERTIVEILARVSAIDLPTEIIVVDDGSTDGTASLVEHVEGITLLRHPLNRGKGEAIATALARAHGEICLTQDADLEYDPADIPALYARYLAGDVDAVYGSRILGPSQGRSSRFFYWGGRLVSLTASVLYGTRITDEPTGYKLIGTALLRSLGVRARRFDFCPELTGRLLRRGGRLVEIPIHYHPRRPGDGKKITARDGFLAIWVLVRERFARGGDALRLDRSALRPLARGEQRDALAALGPDRDKNDAHEPE